ncbi:MAG: glycosyltransferase family 2 protein [Paludibacteraceae bacterium]|nr:glycosyltransferase family 2 protein [Paludibacteraceae bacterium]
MKYCAVIPTFNNPKTVCDVAKSVLQYVERVYVVDDGSTDETKSLLSNLVETRDLASSGIKVLTLAVNSGKGKALTTGFAAAYADGYDYAVTLDSDGQHFAEDIPAMIAKISAEKPTLVCGVRNITTQENMPSKNTFANKFSNFWFKVETGREIPDTQCGFRVYPLKEITKRHIFSSRYEAELEMLVRLCWADVDIQTSPIKVYYAPEGERVTHFRPLADFSRISVMNTVLCTGALLYYWPKTLLKYVFGR